MTWRAAPTGLAPSGPRPSRSANRRPVGMTCLRIDTAGHGRDAGAASSLVLFRTTNPSAVTGRRWGTGKPRAGPTGLGGSGRWVLDLSPMFRSAGAAPPAAVLPVGVSYPTYRGRIDADAAMAYALATNDPNPAYLRGEAVPPLFTASLVLEAVHEAVRACSATQAIQGTRNAVHGSHEVRFFQPVEPTMAVQWRATTYGATRTPAGVLVTQQLLVRTDDGAPLVEHLWSTLYIGGTIDADLGPQLADLTFPPAARALPIARTSFDVTADQGFRYAGASGDRIGHSIDDEIARSEGFPGKLVQGMCTFAMCSGGVVAVAGGDPGRLRRLAGRFARPMFPNQRLVVECYDGGHTDDGLQVIVFEAQAGGETVIKHGWAELAP